MMKRKVNRVYTHLVFSTRRMYKALLILRPSPLVLTIIIVGASIFLLGGGMYDIISKPIAVLPVQGRIIFFYPYYIHEQFLNESLAVMIIYALGVSGLFLIYSSTGQIRNRRQATMLLVVGILFLAISFIMTEVIIYLKMNFS